jgi:hypothetical protein
MSQVQYFVTLVIRVSNEAGSTDFVDAVYEVDETVYNIVKRNVREYTVRQQQP